MRRVFITEPQIKQIELKILHYFPKLLSFQANFRNFCIRLMKLGLFSRKFQKILKNMSHIYTIFLNKGSSLYQKPDFGTHFSVPDRHSCPTPRIYNKEYEAYSSIKVYD